VGGEAEELRILDDLAARGPLIVDDDGLELIEEQLAGDAAEVLERRLEPAHQRAHRLARIALDPEKPREADHHHQGEPLAPGEPHLGEIDLRLVAGVGLEANQRLGLRPRPDLPGEALELGQRAGVAARPGLLEEADGREERVGLQPLWMRGL
jgi:hypothetical protein